MSKPKWFTWTVEFKVDATWVEDGFDLTSERAKRMLAYDLQFARDSEIKARVLSAPDEKLIRKMQGYK